MPASPSFATMGPAIRAAGGVEAALGRALLTLFGDDAGGVRAMLQRDGEHFLGRGHFQVQRHGQFRRQPGDIAVGDMPPILAQMRGDAVRPPAPRSAPP